MSALAPELRADWHAGLRGHLRELARYCAVPVVAVLWWRIAGVPAAHRREVERFARVIVALARRRDPEFVRALLRVVARGAEEKRSLRCLHRRACEPRHYRVVVRE